MSDHFIFLMGKYEARVPKDRLYAPNHMWFRVEGNAYRVGFTAFAVRLLQDVYFLDWGVEPGDLVTAKQEIGEVESSKAVSTLHAPFDGRLLRFNRELMKDPTAINVDNYGAGWLFDFDPKEALLLPPEDYMLRLEGTWDETQRQIKGQINE
ncbi:MAG TPA: glycine cleavage system protein H [Blastocatellia bacterium]|nr:glycine cleavage system protein H [Blastocatellia bacterium]